MRAIERCRTAALGGHVERCAGLRPHTPIAYNTCRNRHCPKCQGAARQDWLAERAGRAAAGRRISTSSSRCRRRSPTSPTRTRRGLRPPVPDRRRDAPSPSPPIPSTSAPRSASPPCSIPGARHMTHHPHVHMIVPGGGSSLDGERWISCRPGFFLPVPRALAAVPTAVPREARRRPRGRQTRLLRRLARTCADEDAFATFLAPLKKTRWFVYTKTPFAGPKAVLAYLSRYTHRVAISNRRLVAVDRAERHLQGQGLPDRGARPLQDDDARRRRVHPPLPHARTAQAASIASVTMASSPTADVSTTSPRRVSSWLCPSPHRRSQLNPAAMRLPSRPR